MKKFVEMKGLNIEVGILQGPGASSTAPMIVATTGHLKKLSEYKLLLDECQLVRACDLSIYTTEVLKTSLVMSATIQTPLYKQHQGHAVVIHIKTEKKYGLLATVTTNKTIREIPYSCLLYGNYRPMKGATTVQVINKNSKDDKVSENRLQLPFQLVAGYNPPHNFQMAIANFSVPMRACTTYPGVFMNVTSSGPTRCDLSQIMGRVGRPFK